MITDERFLHIHPDVVLSRYSEVDKDNADSIRKSILHNPNFTNNYQKLISIINYIKEQGLSYYQVKPARDCILSLSKSLDFEKDFLMDAYRLHPLILNTNEYNNVSNVIVQQNLIEKSLREYKSYRGLCLNINVNQIKDAKIIFKNSQYQISSLLDVYKHTIIQNAWDYQPNIEDDSFIFIINVDEKNMCFPVFYLVLNIAERLSNHNQQELVNHNRSDILDTPQNDYQLAEQAVIFQSNHQKYDDGHYRLSYINDFLDEKNSDNSQNNETHTLNHNKHSTNNKKYLRNIFDIFDKRKNSNNEKTEKISDFPKEVVVHQEIMVETQAVKPMHDDIGLMPTPLWSCDELGLFIYGKMSDNRK